MVGSHHAGARIKTRIDLVRSILIAGGVIHQRIALCPTSRGHLRPAATRTEVQADRRRLDLLHVVAMVQILFFDVGKNLECPAARLIGSNARRTTAVHVGISAIDATEWEEAKGVVM
jgi:hypothetical protein